MSMKNSNFIWMTIVVLSWAAIPLIIYLKDIQTTAINFINYPTEKTTELFESMDNITTKDVVNFKDIWYPNVDSLGDLFKSIPARIDLSNVTGYEQKIPRKIYQTWFNNSFTGPLMKEAAHSWIHLNPEYDYYFFNDQDCIDWISKHCGQRFLNAYLSINELFGAARSDYLRYLLLWKWGGIYVDVDSKLVHPFRDWIHPEDEFITGSGNDVPNQFMLIAKQNHTVYRRVALALTQRLEERRPLQLAIVDFTGPRILRTIYNEVMTERMSKIGESLEDVIIRKIPQISVHMNVGGHVVFKNNWRGIEKEEARFKDHWRDINKTKHSFYVDINQLNQTNHTREFRN